MMHSSSPEPDTLSPVFDTFSTIKCKRFLWSESGTCCWEFTDRWLIVPSHTANHTTTINHTNSSSEELNSVNASTLALLKEHGIAMQEDTDNTLITSALQSGRQLVLSDAGKLLLNDPKFRKSIPTIGGKQSNIMNAVSAKGVTTSTPLTKSSMGPSSTFKFEYVKKKPTMLAPTNATTKAMPLETNKVKTRLQLDKEIR